MRSQGKWFFLAFLALIVGAFWSARSDIKTLPSVKPVSSSLISEARAPAEAKPVTLQKILPLPGQNPAPALVGRAEAPRKEALLQEIQRVKACYEVETCDFPKTDPRSYSFAVGKKLAELLKSYRQNFAKDLANQKLTEALAQEWMPSEDEFIQEAALELMSDVPPSSQNLKVLTSSLNAVSDPLLVDQAMNEMKRYLGTKDEAQVHEYLKDLLGHGAVFASEKAVQKMLPFINSQSYPLYRNLSLGLPPSSTVGKDLRALLQEFHRQQTGG